jgi:hypothetical protein
MLRENSHAELYGSSSATLWENSNAELHGESSATLRDNSHAILHGNSSAVLRGRSSADLHEGSYAELWGESSADLWEKSPVSAYDFSVVNVFSGDATIEHLADHSTASLYGVKPKIKKKDKTARVVKVPKRADGDK